jgi:lipopolysaccharide export system protein LptC
MPFYFFYGSKFLKNNFVVFQPNGNKHTKLQRTTARKIHEKNKNVTSFYARIFIKNAEKHANFQRKHWALRADFAKKTEKNTQILSTTFV